MERSAWTVYVPFIPVPVFNGPHFLGWAKGLALGPLVVIHRDHADDRCLLAHELTHVKQWRRDGWRFFVRYTWQFATKGYLNIDYEIEAMEVERRCRERGQRLTSKG
jgi:hypothetical protein